jgi:hypothetical protein
MQAVDQTYGTIVSKHAALEIKFRAEHGNIRASGAATAAFRRR